MSETTVTVKGQVTIPKAVRDRLGLKPGARVRFAVDDQGRAYLRPAGRAKVGASRFRKLLGTADAGLSTDEIMALTRGR
jgi:AbrB family looped-hinge helix DNA binding protein